MAQNHRTLGWKFPVFCVGKDPTWILECSSWSCTIHRSQESHMCLRAVFKINHPAGKHTRLTWRKKEEGQKPSMCDPCTKYLPYVMLLPLQPEFSNLVTLFTPRHPVSRASCFPPCYFRITPLRRPLSKHPAHILPSSSQQIFYLILPLVSNHTGKQWQPGTDLTSEKWFVPKTEWEVQHRWYSLP